MEITKFGLQNFRVFKEHFDFDLAPIMVLTGPNNSGKSSLSKALLLIKENENSLNSDEPFSRIVNYLTGEHNLGNHNYVMNTQNEDVIFSFTFFPNYKFCIEIKYDSRILTNFKITTDNNELVILQSWFDFEIDVKRLIEYFTKRFEFGLKTKKSKSKIDFKKIERLVYALLSFAENVDTIKINFEDILFENPNNTKDEYEKNLKNRIYIGYFDDSYDLDHIDEDDLATSCYECLIHIFHKITGVVLTKKEILFLIPVAKNPFFTMPEIVYIHTLHESLKRGYSNKDNFELLNKLKKDFSNEKFHGYEEGNVFSHHAFKRKHKDDKLVLTHKFSDGTEYSEEVVLNSRKKFVISKWLKEFEIGENITYGYNEEFDAFFIKVDGKSLLDYGLGFGLIIQILLALDYGNSNEKKKRKNVLNFPSTYIIEEPETGLHPAFQSKMAEMLVDIQKTFNVNLIIETHSEYLIRKLQYLTAVNEIQPGDALIYYFNNPKKVPKGEEQIKRISIDENGSLSDNFGPGFIDEGTNIKFELLRFNKSRNN
jgi:AAA15 family ATPase/GTPase